MTPTLGFNNRLQIGFFSAGSIYLSYVLLSIIFNSFSRASIFTFDSSKGQLKNNLESSISEGSKFGLKDFLRFDFQNGKPVWEIKASRADYLKQNGAVFIHDTTFKAYRNKQAPIIINADSARLQINGASVKDAQLEGGVKIIDDALVIYADHGVYSLDEQKIMIPGNVKISGPGYEVTGRGLSLAIDEESVNLSELVRSEFSECAEVPKERVFNK